jgi:peptide/nickel transport system substrate-binding protein
MRNRKFIYLVPLLAAGLLLAACQPGASAGATSTAGGGATAGGGSTGGAAIIISKDILLDPALATDADSKTVNAYLYEGLVTLSGSDVAPALTQAWSVSDDGLSYTFNLRPAASFHDGTPLTAEAVMANFNRWYDPANALHGSGAYAGWAAALFGFKGELGADGRPKSPYDGIEKVDNLTVLVHLNREDPDFALKLTQPSFAIVSPAALAAGAGYGTGAGVSGTGPYKVSEWSDETLVLGPNAAYWNGAPAAGLTFKLQ